MFPNNNNNSNSNNNNNNNNNNSKKQQQPPPPPNESVVGPAIGVPSDLQAREKLVSYVYEYLLHMGAKSAAASFLQEIQWDKTVNLGEPPGFLHSWWCVFWDLYCAAPERRDSSFHFSPDAQKMHDAQRFHDAQQRLVVAQQQPDYGFVNSGYIGGGGGGAMVNGLHHHHHGPNSVGSPLGMPPSDVLPPGSAGLNLGQHHPGFFASPVPGGPHMRPSPPQQPGAQQSAHVMMNHQSVFMGTGRYPGPPNSRPPHGGRLGLAHQDQFMPGQPPMFDGHQLRGGPPPPHLMAPQRMPPGGGPHHPMRPVGPNGFPGMRPNMVPVMGPGMPPGAPQHLQRSWSLSSGPAVGVSNGPVQSGAPGTPVVPSPQSLPDGNNGGPERFGMMQAGGVNPMGQFVISSEPSGGMGGDLLMNGDGGMVDMKPSPASMHGRLNGGTPGPGQAAGGGPNSVPPPSTSGDHSACGLDYGGPNINPYQPGGGASFRGDQEAEIQKIKDSICEESKRFESGKEAAEADGNFFLH